MMRLEKTFARSCSVVVPALVACCTPVGDAQQGAGAGRIAASPDTMDAGATSVSSSGGAGQSSSSSGGAGGASGHGGAGNQGGAGGANSAFSFSMPKTSNVYAFSDMELADLDGDGCVDLVLAGTGSPPRINVYPGACDGTFPEPPIVHPLTTFDDMALGDVDGDGRADVFTRDTGFPPRITVRKSAPSFALESPVTSQVWTYDGLWIGDVNGDGRVEALTTHFGATPQTVFVWSDKGDGALSALSSVEPPLFDAGAFHGDFLIGSFGFPPRVQWLSGDSSGALSVGVSQDIFTFSSMSLGDLDGDGDADLLTNVPGNDWVISLYANDGGTFKAPMLFQAFTYEALRCADIDGNGKGDIIVAPTGAPPRVTVWLSQ